MTNEHVPKRVCAEIQYETSVGIVHSDICPPHCSASNLDETQWRKFLHDNLDEWLDKSEGTGYFTIGDHRDKLLQAQLADIETAALRSGYVIVNRHGAVVAYVHWPKPEGVKWPESWDEYRPKDAPHVICRLVPVEE